MVIYKKGIKCPQRKNSTSFKKGHTGWNKGKKLHYDVWNKGVKGYKQPKTSKTLKEKFNSRELIHPMLGKKCPRFSEMNKLRKGNFPIKIANKISKANKGKHFSPETEFKKGHRWGGIIKEKQIKNILKGLFKRPTSFEQKICDLCLKYNLPFIYSGDGKFLVGYKNPDFKHKYLPILIEVYNDFHHPKDYEEIRGKHFKKYGYETIFINQQEIMDKNWETICLNKLKDFL